jgi:ubiquinone/menaquinone biosynthesis C-methylase UbiE
LPNIVVSGVDLLPERVEAARQNAPWATFTVGSADRLPDPDGSYDIATAITLFSSVPSPDLEAAIAAEIGRVLRPGGWLVWYDIRYRNPWNPDVHGISRERLTALFPGWVAELRSLGVAPPLARRLGRLTPLLYPTLHMIGPSRSHLVGRMRRPR